MCNRIPLLSLAVFLSTTQLNFGQDVKKDAGTITLPAWASGETVSSSTNSSMLAINGSGDLAFTLAADANGTSTVTLVSTDTFVIVVYSVNDAPSFTKGADQTVNEVPEVQPDRAGPRGDANVSAAWIPGISRSSVNQRPAKAGTPTCYNPMNSDFNMRAEGQDSARTGLRPSLPVIWSPLVLPPGSTPSASGHYCR